MRRRGAWLVLVALCSAGNLRAQQTPSASTLRGVVLAAETSEPIPYSIVELVPGFPRRLTDDAGRFQLQNVSSGRYHLAVRQIGYAPIDSTLDVANADTMLVVIRLARLGITLPAVTVTAGTECRSPGAPDRDLTPDLAAVFEQLVNNARRARLLAAEFPHELQVERTLADTQRPSGRGIRVVDTLVFGSVDTWQYAPGRVVRRVAWSDDRELRQFVNPWSGQDLIRLPTMLDFADTVFVANHCFRLAGRDTVAGRTFVRLDFQPAERIRSSDVGGAAYLDSTSYVVRYTVVHLTRPERGVRGMTSLVATSRFVEIEPWILVTDQIHSVSRTIGTPATERTEDQRLVHVRFAKQPPRR